MGMVPPTGGTISINGHDVTGQPAHAAASHGLALVPEGRRIFNRMTVRENLQVGAVTRPARQIPRLMEEMFELFPVLKARDRQLAGTLSGGEQQMLAIGRALMARPDFVCSTSRRGWRRWWSRLSSRRFADSQLLGIGGISSSRMSSWLDP
jgi:branched-chain amino acid transport system ATP-binding protein